MVAHPDPSTFQILPWRPGMAGVARMFCDIRTPEGMLFEGDPRAVLRRTMSRASDLGLSFYVGSEIEFFLFGTAKTPAPLDVGTYFDLRVELLKNGVVVASGQVDGVSGGSSGFNNAIFGKKPK